MISECTDTPLLSIGHIYSKRKKATYHPEDSRLTSSDTSVDGAPPYRPYVFVSLFPQLFSLNLVLFALASISSPSHMHLLPILFPTPVTCTAFLSHVGALYDIFPLVGAGH
jgi:hypothetical protein